jgi:hypothetical protein
MQLLSTLSIVSIVTFRSFPKLTLRREDPGLRYELEANIEACRKLTTTGIFLPKYPNITGTDIAGEVYEVGEGVTHVKKGDRVIRSGKDAVNKCTMQTIP